MNSMLKLEQINVKTNSLEPFPPNQGGIETQKDEQVEDPQKFCWLQTQAGISTRFH